MKSMVEHVLYRMHKEDVVKKMKQSTAKCFDFSGAGGTQQLSRYIQVLWKSHFSFRHGPWEEEPSSARRSSPVHFCTIL